MSPRVFFQGEAPNLITFVTVCCSVVIGGFCFATLWLNQDIFRSLNGWHSPFSDAFWLACTTMGDGYLLGVLLGCFVVYHPRIALLGLAALLLSAVMIQALKALFPIARPVELLQTVHVVGPVLRYGTFPSGHAAAGMSVALTLYSFSPSRSLRWFLLMAAVLVGVSRIFVGAHFPLDVAAGMLTATLSFALCTGLVWPFIEQHVWQRPAWDSAFFRALYYMELLAGSGALLLYSTLFAESGIAGAVVSSLIIIVTLPRFRKA